MAPCISNKAISWKSIHVNYSTFTNLKFLVGLLQVRNGQGKKFQSRGKLTLWRKVRKNEGWFNTNEGWKKLLGSLWSQWYFYFLKKWKGRLLGEARRLDRDIWHFVFIWSGKLYFYQGKVRKFWKVMSVATMSCILVLLILETRQLVLLELSS